MIVIPDIESLKCRLRFGPGTTARDVAIARLAGMAEGAGGGLLAWYALDEAQPRGRGAVAWVPHRGDADAIVVAAPGELERAVSECFPRGKAGKHAHPSLICHAAETDEVTVSETRAWHTMTLGCRAEVKRWLMMERMARRGEYVDEEAGRCFDIVESEPDGPWRIRWATGVSRRATWYDAAAGRRAQRNVGDLMVIACPHEPEIREAAKRKHRPMAEYDYLFFGDIYATRVEE